MEAKMSDEFAIGDRVSFLSGRPPASRRGRVGHLSFYRSGGNQVLVVDENRNAAYVDEDDAELIG